jgi:hypothetical protein
MGERKKEERSKECIVSIRSPTDTEHIMVNSILRLALPSLRFCGNNSAVACDCNNNNQIQQTVKSSSPSAVAIYLMGDICGNPQLLYMAA